VRPLGLAGVAAITAFAENVLSLGRESLTLLPES